MLSALRAVVSSPVADIDRGFTYASGNHDNLY